jgi:hypothetical protein
VPDPAWPPKTRPTSRVGDDEPFRKGCEVGRYLIFDTLGAGGMGVVYGAYDPQLDRRVAIKVLRGAAPAERILGEGQELARLSHPNVLPVVGHPATPRDVPPRHRPESPDLRSGLDLLGVRRLESEVLRYQAGAHRIPQPLAKRRRRAPDRQRASRAARSRRRLQRAASPPDLRPR